MSQEESAGMVMEKSMVDFVHPIQSAAMMLVVAYGFVSFLNHNVNAVPEPPAQRRNDVIDPSRFDFASLFPSDEAAKKTLFNEGFRNLIEMAYWFVKFVGDYTSLYKETQEAASVKATDLHFNSPTQIFSKTTGSLIKFSRYYLKYVDSYQKLYKAAEHVG